MTREETRKALLGEILRAKEIRSNDGRAFVVERVEPRALGTGRLV